MTERCDLFEGLLARAADDALDPSDQARLHAHLAACPSCADALAAQREMREALHVLAGAPTITRAGDRAVATLRADARRADRTRQWIEVLDWRRWTWRLAPVAAALAVAVATVSRPAAATLPAAEVTPQVETTDPTRPASAALVTGEVTGEQLLQLLLSGGPDAAMPTTAVDTGGGQ